MKVFPTRLFYFDGFDPGTDQRTLSGGTSLSGQVDLVVTDGGGVVAVEFSDPDLAEPDALNAWSAIDTVSDGGAHPFIVPLTDAKHQQFGDITTPIGGFPWWEEADFADTEPHASLNGGAALRATLLTVDVSKLSGQLHHGIWLSIDHDTWRHRAYRIAEIRSDDGLEAVLSIRPPLREATAADTPVEFYDPKCTMRVDGSMRAPRSFGFASAQGVRFVEDFSGAYE
jgi:hypothetical protein